MASDPYSPNSGLFSDRRAPSQLDQIVAASVSAKPLDCSPVIVVCSSLIGFSAHELFDLARRRRVGTRVIADDLGTELGVGRQVGNIETVACFRINARLKRGAG